MDVTKGSFLGDSTSYTTKRFRRPKVNSSGLFLYGFSLSSMRVDGNLLYKATLPTDINDCSGRQYPSRKGVGGHGLEGLQPVAHEVDTRVLHRVRAEVNLWRNK